MYSAMDKLYGLKLYQGVISEDKIPAHRKENALKYYEELKNSK